MKTAIEIIGNHICITIEGSVDSHYDVLQGVIPDSMLEEKDFQDPAIVHFTGPEKPWFAGIPMKRYWTEAEKAYRAWRKQG